MARDLARCDELVGPYVYGTNARRRSVEDEREMLRLEQMAETVGVPVEQEHHAERLDRVVASDNGFAAGLSHRGSGRARLVLWRL